MKIALIHLSDIHISSDNNTIFDKIEKMCQSIQKFIIEAEGIFLIITGDIAYSGSASEYEKAKELIDRLKTYISTYSEKKVHIIMVPGNHDCNFAIEKNKARQILMKDVQENGDSNIDESVINSCCEVQKQYFDLMREHSDIENAVFSDKLVWITDYCFGAYNIIFNCYNTAWISDPEEEPGKIHFPIKTYSADHFQRRSNLNISVFHHTLNWFNPTNRRDFSGHIENTSHIIFTGHEHVSTKAVKDNLEGTKTYFIEGAVLQDKDQAENSGFKILIADLSQKNLKINTYKWNGALYELSQETGWISYQGEKITDKVLFPIRSEFEEKFLNNVGAQIRHPNKTDVYLEDIFIFPHLRDLRSYKREDKDFCRDVVESSVLCKIKESNKILLVGHRNSGKTTLCKIIFKYYHNNNYIPIYIEGEKLRTTSIDAFYKVVDDCYLEQYQLKKQQEFTQLNNSSKVVIIDDFDKLRLPSKSRSTLLRNIHRHFQNVIITGGYLLPIDEVLSEEMQKELAIDGYEQYEIMEFGHLLRSRLINRWNTLGKEELIGEEELIRKHDEAQQVFNTIIGKNYVPAFPIFLLIILQTIEVGRPHDLEESSFGHYYQYLIFDSLSRVINKSDEINAYYNFLIDFSYHLFIARACEISKDGFHDFHSQYCEDYAISTSFHELVNPNLLIRNLVSADLIEDKNGVYKFRYPYIFNFFIAKYLANNLNNETIRQTISNMCRRIYREQFADIVIFLTHHSKDPFVLDEILSSARSLFAEYAPIKFENDMISMNKLLGEIPKLILEKKDIIEYRENKLKSQDEREFSTKSEISQIDKEIPDIYEPIKPINLIAELNVAFKTIEILGQILKNYSGSLRRPLKLALGEEAYMLGLRALNPFYKILEEKKENLVKWIGYVMDKKKLDKEGDHEEEYRVILFAIFAGLSYGFVKIISSSVGSERLSPTFKEILGKHDITSVNLIDASIKLDFYRRFPHGDLKKVKEKVVNNILPYALLREMVREYLYMFPTDYRKRQKICQLVEITMIEQRMIEETSTQKKLLPP